jgi:hypothetical protein
MNVHLTTLYVTTLHVTTEPKGEALHLSIESSILGSLQSNWLIAKNKVELVRHPQLINMKQNTIY